MVQSVINKTICWMFLSVACTLPASAAENPIRLATEGRLDLIADASVQSLEHGEFNGAKGTASRPNWGSPDMAQRTYSVSFPISRLGWREYRFRFTPEQSGNVTLRLIGPWQEARKGVLFQQEVLWSDLTCKGGKMHATISADSSSQWIKQGGTIENEANGHLIARTWHNGGLSTTIQVQAKVPVELSWKAKAVTPASFTEMKRIESTNTPAHQTARRFMKGTNFGNYLEAPRNQNWGATYTEDDVKAVKSEGFDHIRLPIAWHHYVGPAPAYTLEKSIFAKVDVLVDQAVAHGLGIIVNEHHFDAFTSDPAAHTDQLHAIWRQVADHYRQRPDSVVFELLNEPKDAATTERLGPIYASLIRLIRQTNPNRTIFIGPGRWNAVSELPLLQLPDDQNLIVTTHCYDPFYFTHQGATWSGDDVKVTGIVFPGPPATPLVPDAKLDLKPHVHEWLKRYNSLPTPQNPSGPAAFVDAVRAAREWSTYYGRPVHMGEFGSYIKADPNSRANYYRLFREELDRAGLGWAIWDWKAGFRYWNAATRAPEPGMREALFAIPSRKTRE